MRLRRKHTIRWKPARDGFVYSHDGHWEIVPEYAGCTRPQSYAVYYDCRKLSGLNATQKEAKEVAERLTRRSSSQ